MKEAIFIFLGGGLGSLSRFLLGRGVSHFHPSSFPFGTLAVNVTACFILGIAIGLADHRQLLSPSARLFWTVGFCGGFSTFSTFSQETLTLAQNGQVISSILYITASLMLCLLATFGGMYLVKLS